MIAGGPRPRGAEVPPRGFEPLPLVPETSALSPELRGRVCHLNNALRGLPKRAIRHERAVIMAALLAGTGAPARILIADDDPIILRLLQVNLDLEGFAVDTAARGEDALARARETPPDVILLDVMMPGLTGWDVARQLKEDARTAGIPIVFLSARTQEEDLRRGEELGVAAYVTKPFDPGDLVELIHQLSNTAR